MGSKSGWSPSGGGESANADKLQDIARRELEKPSPQPRRRVFISFRGEDKPLVDLFRGQAKNENSDLDFIDYSLRVPFNSKNAEYIKSGIRERIKQSSVTIVFMTKDTHKSEWVDWEIRESHRLGKGVIGVKREEDQTVRIPEAMEEKGCKVVNWNHAEINRAINTAAEDRKTNSA